MINKKLASEVIPSGNKNYFLHYMIAKNDSQYISLSRSDKQPDGTYLGKTVVIFEEDFEFLISAFSSLFHTAAYALEKEKTTLDLFRDAQSKKAAKGIKSWDPELRPREKFIQYGAGMLSDRELLAMLIGSGTPNVTAIDLAEKILNAHQNNLHRIAVLDHESLAKFKGIGPAKASTILASLELGNRMNKSNNSFKFQKGKKPLAFLKKA